MIDASSTVTRGDIVHAMMHRIQTGEPFQAKHLTEVGQSLANAQYVKEDAAYIAALNPVVALALIARIRELESALAPFAVEGRDIPYDVRDDEAWKMIDFMPGDLRRAARLTYNADAIRKAARISKEAADG